MKSEIAARHRAEIRDLPLGTTSGSRTEQDRPLDERELRRVLKAVARATDALLTDAEHRRRDIQDLVDLRPRVSALELAGPAELVPVEEPDDAPSTWWRLAILGAAVGGIVALHALELGAIAVLLLGWR